MSKLNNIQELSSFLDDGFKKLKASVLAQYHLSTQIESIREIKLRLEIETSKGFIDEFNKTRI